MRSHRGRVVQIAEKKPIPEAVNEYMSIAVCYV